MNKVKYFLSYDLINTRDYQKLYDELDKFKAKRVLESVWCFKYDADNSKNLREHFRNFIDRDDRLLIIQSADWAATNLMYNPNNL